MNDIREAADSIYSYIERTAEKTEGGYRWQTINYYDKPHYSYTVFNGVGGIPLFLRDYYRLSGESRALELARGALEWCIRYKVEGEREFERGVQFGKTGVAYTALYLAGNDELPEYCVKNADHLLSEPVGPVTDLIGGESSNGWFLLKMWEKTGNGIYLNGAIRCGRWLADNMIRDELGTYCLIRPDGEWFGDRPNAGLAHGIAGVAHFITLLYKATRDDEWKVLARELLDTLVRAAIPAKGGLNWCPTLGGDKLIRCQHTHGAPGIGLVFARASVIMEDDSLRDIALKAGEATYAYGDFRNNPILCNGLAGSGELFIELYNLTGDELWWDRAKEFARLAMAYRHTTEEGDFWPTDPADLYSADFSYGAAGTGHFFLRTLRPAEFSMPLM